MAEDQIEYLSKLHFVAAKAQEDIDFLETMITNPVIPPVVQGRFAEIQTTISIQAHLIRLFTEEQFGMEDELDKIRQLIATFPKKK